MGTETAPSFEAREVDRQGVHALLERDRHPVATSDPARGQTPGGRARQDLEVREGNAAMPPFRVVLDDRRGVR